MIESEWQRFIAAYTYQPTRLFLGKHERAALKDVGEQVDAPEGVTVRAKWRSIPVYEVDAEHFIGFGLDVV